MIIKITKQNVNAAQPSNKDAYCWDDVLKGFGLKVTPKGRKVYLVQYQIGGRAGRTRRVTIGKHGVFTPGQAREEAKRILRMVSRGDDPAAARDQRKEIIKTGDLLEKFLVDYVFSRLKPASITEYRRLIETRIPPLMKIKPIKEITRPDIAALHQSLQKTPYQANRVLAVLSKFFNWCEKHGHRDDFTNPVRFIDKYKESKRRRFLTEVEMARLGDELIKVEEDGSVNPYVIAAIRLLALTGARLREITTLRWEYVDLEEGCLNLPDSKEEHDDVKKIYLNEPARELLASIPKMLDNPYVICGGDPGEYFKAPHKNWYKIRDRADLGDVRIHDLRHPVSGW